MPTTHGRAPAAPREERQVLAEHLARNGLKRSAQREAILEAFLKAGHHVSVEDLLKIVRKREPEVGRTTIYRTLKLFQEAGLASELLLGGEARFEPLWKRDHHDHFVCVSCREIIEFQSPEIERLQDEIAGRLGFVIEGHRHHIFGRCRKCAEKSRLSPRRR
jgi:Fur family transcriptional regulator, ferric uptake regulator